jgi:AraC-like DNA-binding protein
MPKALPYAPSEHFQTFEPADPRLKGLVAYYYLHTSDDPSFESSFTYYPHYRNALTIYLDSYVDFSDSISHVRPGVSGSSRVLFSRNYDQRISVHLNGAFKKVGIAFEPLGINAFIDSSLARVAIDKVNDFGFFDPHLPNLVRKEVATSAENLVPTLDNFLMSKYIGFDNNNLKAAVAKILESDGSIGVEILSAELGLSRKTLLRMFREHLCTSVEGYKKLVRFRNALNHYLLSENKTTFTALALDHQYYDQPAFIKHFKSITGLSPRAFFAQLKQYGEKDTFWAPR